MVSSRRASVELSAELDCARFALMLLGGGELDGTRLLGRATVDLMMADHLPEGAFPYPPPGFEIILPGQGFGLGGAVVTTFGEIGTPRSVGSYGWRGLAGTHQTLFWGDRKESLAGVVMLQARTDMRPPIRFESLVYQALA
jgi:CubicO group peptidase (beta-lactamase class C family)